jgi:periplasmic divalent cation tolerance protein
VARSENPGGKAEESAISVLLSTCPPAAAEEIAAFLVESRRAACVNIVPGVKSIYRWQGSVERGEESLLVIKCAAARRDEVARALVEKHPYEVPEVVALETAGGHAAYLRWVLEASGGA